MPKTSLLNVSSSNQSGTKSNSTICPDLNDLWEIVYYIVPKYINTVCIIGMLGNAFVLFTYSLYKGPLKIAEIYLMNLAAADLIFLTCLAFWAENIRNEFNWPFGSTSTSISLNMYTSIYLLVAVSVDRYLTFIHTLDHRVIRRKSTAKGICLLTWFFGSLLIIPTFMFRTVKHFPLWNISACTLDFPTPLWVTTERLVFNTVGFALPSTAVIFLNFSTIRSLKKRQGNAEHSEQRVARSTEVQRLQG